MTEDSELPSNDRSGVRVARPDVRLCPIVFSSPHSGRAYPEAFLDQAILPERLLRRSEDAYVDELFARAPELGASLICADFPRSYVDVNRHPEELDQSMFYNSPEQTGVGDTARSRAGLGVVPRIAADGRSIYDQKMPYETARGRLDAHYRPYHDCLKNELDDIRSQFSEAILIDCHSMPSASIRTADIVLGDRFGQSCAPALTALAEAMFRKHGLRVVRNRPYAGGFITEHYGRPSQGIQALQVEINRSLYLEEYSVSPKDELEKLQSTLTAWMCDLIHAISSSRLAAE